MWESEKCGNPAAANKYADQAWISMTYNQNSVDIYGTGNLLRKF
jgi:hypothetical protein